MFGKRLLTVALVATAITPVLGVAPAMAADTAAPVLVDFDFEPKTIDLSGGPQVVAVAMQITDDESGAQPPTFYWDSDSTSQTAGLGPANLVSGTPQNGVYVHHFQFEPGVANGTWTAKLNPISDNAGHSTPAGPGGSFPTTLTITGSSVPAGTPGAPTGVSAVAGNATATVSWTAPVSDGGSPITGYIVTSSPGSVVENAGPSATSVAVSPLNNGTSYTFTVKATNAVGTGPASASSNAVTPTAPVVPPEPEDSGYFPLTPARILDTRTSTAIAGGTARDLTVTGVGGVPGSGVRAVALNVTVTQPAAAGFLTVYPNGAAQPLASNLNYTKNLTRANLVMAKVGTSGGVKIFASQTAHVVADVVGYYADGGVSLTSLTPARLVDTRNGTGGTTGPVAASSTTDFTVTGVGGVPGSGVTAVVVNVTAVSPAAAGHLTVFPDGVTMPTASTLNYTTGSVVPNLALAKVSAGGKLSIFSLAATQLVVDVVGWFGPAGADTFTSLTPFRQLDTRNATGGPDAPVAGGTSRNLTVTGVGGVPASGVSAVVLNVTVATPAAAGYLTVYPTGGAVPTASNLNYVAGQVVPNLVLAKVGAGGQVSFFSSQTTEVIADVVGWFG